MDNTPGDKLGVWRDMRLADAFVLSLLIVFPIAAGIYIGQIVRQIVQQIMPKLTQKISLPVSLGYSVLYRVEKILHILCRTFYTRHDTSFTNDNNERSRYAIVYLNDDDVLSRVMIVEHCVAKMKLA